MIEKMSPILPSRDIRATEDFYRRLGFRTIYVAEDYLLMKREEAEAHFFHHAHHRPEASDHGAYLRPDDIDALSAEFAALGLPRTGIPRFEPAAVKPWGMKELVIVDPDGNLLRAGQEI
jgi:catechol 2,3-dioxygenase-like lactoylglutathione lyase family enzyme